MSDITVLMPTCNRSAFLRESIDSVLAELSAGDELLVIDDGSTDDTVAVLHSFGDALRFISIENGGKPAALNLALKMTSKPLVWIMDDDDLVLAGARDTLVSLLEAEQADLVYGRYDRFREDASGQRQTFGTGHWVDCDPGEVLVRTLEDSFIHQPGLIVRRALYERVGDFNVQDVRSNDYDMLIRLLQHGRVCGTNDVVFLQRYHAGLRGHGNASIRDLNRAWIDADQVIFKRLRETLPLDCYTPARSTVTPEQERAALLQRGAVYARRKLWRSAADDFERAAGLFDAPLSAEETSIVRQAVFSKYGCPELVENDVIYRQLCDRLLGSQVGDQIIANLSRALLFYVKLNLRSGRLLSASRFGQRVLQLAGRTPRATRQLYGV